MSAEIRKRSLSFKTVVGIFIGVITMIVGANLVFEQYLLERNGNHVAGTIVGYKEIRGRRGHTKTFPVVSFRSADGQNFQYRTRSQYSGLPVGSTVALIYDPANPANVDLGRPHAGFMAFVFIVILSIPAVVLVLHRKNMLPDFRKRRKNTRASQKKSGPAMTGYSSRTGERAVSYEMAIADVAALEGAAEQEFTTLGRSDGATLQFYPTVAGGLYAESFIFEDGTIFFDDIAHKQTRTVVREFFDGKAPAELGLTQFRTRDVG